MIRHSIGIYAFAKKKKKLVLTYLWFVPLDCYLIASMIILHYYRFNFSGKYCACREDDYCDYTYTSSQPGFLIRRGRMLTGLVAVFWIMFGFNLLMISVILIKSARVERLKELAMKEGEPPLPYLPDTAVVDANVDVEKIDADQ